MNEITIPINQSTIKLLQQYAQTLEGVEQETILKTLQIADVDLAIAEKEAQLADLKAEAQTLTRKRG